MNFNYKLDDKIEYAILSYIQDNIEISSNIINTINDNPDEDNNDNILDFIDKYFKIDWSINNLNFGKYSIVNNFFNEHDINEMKNASKYYRCGDEEEQKIQYNNLSFIYSRIGYHYLNENTDFLINFIKSHNYSTLK
jgi:hypothetical protein